MGLAVGSSGPLVDAWIRVMNTRFASYSRGADGKPLREDGKFGLDDARVAAEWQERVKRPFSTDPWEVRLSDEELCLLGLGPHLPPLLVTVHGTGVTMYDGPPADVARELEKIGVCQWQPIGNYPARPFPMWGSIQMGVAEVDYQVARYPGRRIWACGYSQGAIVLSLSYKYGALKTARLEKAFMFANPMREEGVGGVAGAGALEDRMVNTPAFWREYAHSKDLYASVPTGDGWGENIRAITKIVMGNNWWSGKDSILMQLAEIGINPLSEGWAAFEAILRAGLFFGSKTGPHVLGLPVGDAVNHFRVT